MSCGLRGCLRRIWSPGFLCWISSVDFGWIRGVDFGWIRGVKFGRIRSSRDFAWFACGRSVRGGFTRRHLRW